MLQIVLYEPEIPFNTGAIGRSCVAVGARLHLIEPLGFSLEEKAVRRSGLDYWPLLDYRVHANYAAFLEREAPEQIFYVTTKGGRSYADLVFEADCYFLFGKESAGLPADLLAAAPERCLRIPMAPGIRSLNLSNAVAVLLYEGMRQQGFASLQT